MKNIKKSTLLLAVIAIAALIFGGVELGNVNSLKDKIANIGETLGIDNLGELAGDKLTEALNSVKGAVNDAADAAKDAADAAKDAAEEAKDAAADAAQGAADAAQEAVEDVVDAVNDTVENAVGGENK
ncbi:MAG: hypothetical protein IKP32_04085 [Clostridia bacterium]|nr:hypothetical protein [Clostridia bacterium]